MTSAVIRQLETYGPRQCPQLSLDEARVYTRRLTRSHYENFTVVSWFLPRRLREDFASVYAFCRWADDLGDEVGDPARSLQLLDWWEQELDHCYAGTPRHPVYVALAPTIAKHEIPRQPFADLIDAFRQDQRVQRYDTQAQVLDYCRRSADPVGRLVLYMAGYRDAERQQLSDRTCTALQLANFWQDVRRDILERDRVYLPAEVADRHGLDIEAMVRAVRANEEVPPLLPAYTATVRELCDWTWPMFAEGRQLLPMVDAEVRLDIELFTRGGEAVLKLIERRGYDTLTRRPKLGRRHKLSLMLQAVAGKLWLPVGGRPRRAIRA